MTDLEISKQLALAIGWTEAAFRIRDSKLLLQQTERHIARKFDYRDWATIGPIAERYDCFPQLIEGEWGAIAVGTYSMYQADTPQKAIAMAVIEGVKK